MDPETLGTETLTRAEHELSLAELQPYLREVDFASQIEYLGGVEGLSQAPWAELSPAERLETLKDLEARLAEVQGRDPRLVVARDYPDDGHGVTYGHYDETNPGEINISRELLERPELRLKAFHTLAHEGRHAFQHDAVRGLVYYNPQVVAYWRANWDQYLSARRFGFEIYRSQPLELDANSFADRIVSDVDKRYSESVLPHDGRETWSLDRLFDADVVRRFGYMAVLAIGRTFRRL